MSRTDGYHTMRAKRQKANTVLPHTVVPHGTKARAGGQEIFSD